MNDLKATSVLQKLYKDSAREGRVSLVSTHDVTNPLVHYCTVGNDPDIGKKWILLKICTIVGNCFIRALQKTASKSIEFSKSYF